VWRFAIQLLSVSNDQSRNAALDQALKDKSSLASRRAFYRDLIDFLDENGHGTMAELDVVEHIRSYALVRAAADRGREAQN
jgi:hypothetical protein